MNKNTFDKIQAALEARVSKCELFLYGIETTDDLKKLTIERAQALQKFCRAEEALMTKIVQCDLYHIIGMGNLTAPQMVKFTYLIKEYLQYRGTIKALAMNFDKISSLPGIPVTAIYKLHVLGDVTLTTGMDFEDEVVTTSDVPYAMSGNLIQVVKERAAEFINFWAKKAKVSLSVENFLAKASAGHDYGGVRWTIDHLGNYVGVIQTDNVRQMFEGCLK